MNPSISNLPAKPAKNMEIEIYNRMSQVDPFKTLEFFGNIILRSGLFPMQRAEQGQLLAMLCLAKQMTPLEIKRDYHVLADGNVSKKTLAALAEFRNRGGKHKWLAIGDKFPEGKPQDPSRYAEIELSFDGQTIKSRFTMADALRADVSLKPGSAWVKTPANMLRARAVSNGIAMLAPEIYAGDVDDDYQASDAAGVEMPATAGTTTVEIQAQTAQEPARQETAPAPAPVAPAETAPAAAPAEQQQPAPENKATKGEPTAPLGDQLPPEIVLRLEKALTVPGHEPAALKWLVKKHWITQAQADSGCGLSYLAEPHANQILNATEKFIVAIGK